MEKTNFEKTSSCSDCRFSDRLVQEDGRLQVICRHKPPTLAYAFMQGSNGAGQVLSQSIWPVMGIGDYCSLIELGDRPNRVVTPH